MKLLYKRQQFFKSCHSVKFQKPELNDSAYVTTHISTKAILMFLIERL